MSDLTCLPKDILTIVSKNCNKKDLGSLSRVSLLLRQWVLGMHVNMCKVAAFRNSDLLMYEAIKNGLVCTYETIYIAIQLGNLDVIQWMFRNGLLIYCNACDIAAIHGQFEVLKWLFSVGFSVRNDDGRPLQYFNCIVFAGHLEVAKWLHTKNPDGCLNSHTMVCAAETGNLDMVMWLNSIGCEWDEYALICATKLFHWPIFDFLYEITQLNDELFPKKDKLFHDAVLYDSVGIFERIHRRGVIWNEKICTEAISQGKLEILQWAHRNGYSLKFEPGCIVRSKKVQQWLCSIGHPQIK